MAPFFQFTNRLIGAHASFEVTFHRICEKEKEGEGAVSPTWRA